MLYKEILNFTECGRWLCIRLMDNQIIYLDALKIKVIYEDNLGVKVIYKDSHSQRFFESSLFLYQHATI